MKKHGLLFTVCSVLALASVSAYAQDSNLESEFSECANKSEMADRLICYDNLAVDRGLLKSRAQSKSDKGNWRVEVETSPIDDSKTVVVSTPSTEKIKARYGFVEPILFLRCKEGELNMYIHWGTFIGTQDAYLTLRFGTEEAYDEAWSTSTSRKATFAPNPAAKIRGLERVEKFLARVTPYGENPVLASFDTTGLKEASAQLKEVCDI